MVSKTLLRLIDETILPALLLVFMKLFGLWLSSVFFNLDWNIKSGVLLPQLGFASNLDLVLANSYSNVFVVIGLFIGMIWILARAYHFHETHITPVLTLKLLQFNLTKLITSSVEIYHKGLVWLSYLWLVTIVILLQVWGQIAYGWVGAFAVIVSLFVTWLFIVDLERELEYA